MKNREGISLAVLIVTIVVLIILLGVIGINVANVGEETRVMQFVDELKIIETKVLVEQYKYNTMENYELKGTQLDTNMTVGSVTYPRPNQTWYIVDEDDLADIGVKNIKGTYIVNYATGEVVSQKGVKLNGVRYYTSNDAGRALKIIE